MSPLVIKPNAQEFLNMKVPVNTTYIGYLDVATRKINNTQKNHRKP